MLLFYLTGSNKQSHLARIKQEERKREEVNASYLAPFGPVI